MQGLRSKLSLNNRQSSKAGQQSHMSEEKSSSSAEDILHEYDQQQVAYERILEKKQTQRTIHNLSQIAYSTGIRAMLRAEMFRVLEAIFKKLQLSAFEQAAFHCCIELSKWQLHHKVIINNIEFVQDYVNCATDRINKDYASLLLYLMLVGFAAKQKMNLTQKPTLEKIQKGISELIQNFPNIYQNWIKSYNKILVINPSLLNKSFMLLKKTPEYDYIQIAETIVNISTAYNSNKN